MLQNCSIEFKQPYLKAGQELIGTIFFTIDKDYIDAELSIKFIGKEQSKILELFNISQDNKNPHKIDQESIAKLNNLDISLGEDSQIVINEKIRPKQIQYIKNDQGSLMRVVRNYGGRFILDNEIKIRKGRLFSGVYKIKLQFTTSEGWPSSHQWQQNTEMMKQKAQVRYYIKFQCQDTNNPSMKVQCQRDMIINAFNIPQQIERQISGDIVGWFCCLRGTVQMKCSLQTNEFFPGEECVVKCEIDNSRCQSPVGPIILSIINKLVLIDESGYEKIILQNIQRKEFIGVTAGQSKIGDQAIILKISIPLTDQVPSTLGQYIQSKNYLKIEAFTGYSNTQFKSKPIIQIPIIVQNAIRPQRTPSVMWSQAIAIDIDSQIVTQNNLISSQKQQQNLRIENLQLQMKMTDSIMKE